MTTIVLHLHCIYTGDTISTVLTLYLHRWHH